MNKLLFSVSALLIIFSNNLSALNDGDIIVFSSGSTNGIPTKYRTLGQGKDFFSEAKQKYAEKIGKLVPETTLFINAYPAFIPFAKGGIYTDTYLDKEKFFASLKLAYDNNITPVIIAQPLYALEVFLQYQHRGLDFPKRFILIMGGYPIPSSLIKKLEEICEDNQITMIWLAGHGVAEIDAGLFFGMETDDNGEILYYPRSDVKLELCNVDSSGFGEMRIYKENGPHGELIMDRAKRIGDAYIIRAESRKVSFEAFRMLESWTHDDWERKTGYFSRSAQDNSYIFQLREGNFPEHENEVSFYSFAKKFGGFNWCKKPNWQ